MTSKYLASLGCALALVAQVAGQATATKRSFDETQRELYRAQLAAAESAFRLGDYSVAREWLNATDRDRRGFEWHAMIAQMDESIAEIRTSGSIAKALAVDPNGQRFACGLNTGEIELRRLPSGDSIRRLIGHKSSITSVKFSAAGDRLVSASFDRSVKIWNVADGKCLSTFAKHGFPVGGAVLLADGKSVASAAYERSKNNVQGTVHIWDAATGAIARTMHGGRKPLTALAISQDGSTLAAASWDFCAFTWPVAGGQTRTFTFPGEGIYNACDGVAFSPDGKQLAACGKDKTARVWNLEDGELKATLRGHADYVSKLTFSADGASIVTASADASLRIWNAGNGVERAKLLGHTAAVNDVAVDAKGGRFVSASDDGTVRVWEGNFQWYGGVRLKCPAAPYVVRFKPDGSKLASCGYDGRIQIWDTATWKIVRQWQAHPMDKSCHMLDWSSDGAVLASGSYDQMVKLWSPETGELRGELKHVVPLVAMRLSRDGAKAVSAGGNRAFLWDLKSNNIVAELRGHTQSLTNVAFSENCQLVVTCGRDGQAIIWSSRDGKQRSRSLFGANAVTAAAFTADSEHVAIANSSGNLTLHHVADGRQQRTLCRHRHAMTHVEMSPDGSRLAFAADVIGIVDVQWGGLLASFRPQLEHPYNLAFSANGLRLATCSTDRTIRIFESQPLRNRLGQVAAQVSIPR